MGNSPSMQPLLKQNKNQTTIPKGAEKHRTKVSLFVKHSPSPKARAALGRAASSFPRAQGTKEVLTLQVRRLQPKALRTKGICYLRPSEFEKLAHTQTTQLREGDMKCI